MCPITATFTIGGIFVAKVIGDQNFVFKTDGMGGNYLQLSGSYVNKSKYVRVIDAQDTTDFLDENGNEQHGNPAEGLLAIKQSWPGQMRTIYGDHKRFFDTYFSMFTG